MITILKDLQTEVHQWKEKYNDLKESISEQEINKKVQRKVSDILQPFFSDTHSICHHSEKFKPKMLQVPEGR